MTRLCARGAPPSSPLSPLCAPREPLQRRCFGVTRRSGEAYNDYANYIVFRILVFIFGFFHGRFAVLSTNLPRTFHDAPKIGAICGILRGILARWYGDLPLNLARYSRDLPLHGKHANLLRASLSFFDGLAKFGKSAIAT